MHLVPPLALFCLLVAAHGAEPPPPLVYLPLDGDPANRGTLGGRAEFASAPTGEDALLGDGPFGDCLDLTAARRHGGPVEDQTPSGGAVTLRLGDRPAPETFTLLVWARQNPRADGVSARLAVTDQGWDWMPADAGLVLALGSGEAKVSHALTRAHTAPDSRPPAPTQWRCYAVVADSGTLRAYLAGLDWPPQLVAEAERRGPRAPDWGTLTVGNFPGLIRPFNGWLARFRVYDAALAPEQLAAVVVADQDDARRTPPRLLPARPPAAPPPRFAWRLSAIPFSTRWQKPEALAVLPAFHTTDCLWVYGAKPEFIRQVRDLGLRYQGTVNGLQGTAKATPQASNAGDAAGRHEDLDGNKNMPSWMVTFKPPHYTGCCNHPAFRQVFLADVRQYLAAGVDMIQVDDSAMNASWVRYGGVCFCEPCRTGFREYLVRTRTPEALAALGVTDLATFDYRAHLKANGVPDAATYRKRYRELPLTPDFEAFQCQSTRDFYRELRRRLDEWSPDRYIPVSVNEGIPEPAADNRLWYAGLVDFVLGEAYDRTLEANLLGHRTAEALGLTQVASPVPKGVADANRTIALAYAAGHLHLVPWDVYMGSDATGIRPRYFGTREEYGPTFDFIAAHPRLFDDTRPLSEVGILVNADVDTARPRLRALVGDLARRQLPFRLLVCASRQARVALRPEDLRDLRVLVAWTPLDSLVAEDRATLDRALAEHRTLLVSAPATLESLAPGRSLDVLAVEGPEGLVALPRRTADGVTVVHVVNGCTALEAAAPEVFGHVTVTLRHPGRWGTVSRATYCRPGAPDQAVEPERHPDCTRFPLPVLETWGVLVLEP